MTDTLTQEIDKKVERLVARSRIDLVTRVVDRKKAEVEHLEDTKRGIVAKLAEERAYLNELKVELRQMKKEYKENAVSS